MNKVIMFLVCCLFISCFDSEPHLMGQIRTPNGSTIKILHTVGHATAEAVILVLKDNNKEPIRVLPEYDILVQSDILNDTMLRLVLRDTIPPECQTKIDCKDTILVHY